MNLVKEPKFYVFIVLSIVLLVIALLDVGFVYNEKRVTGDGVILFDRTVANNLIAALDAANVPYKLDTSDDRFDFTWDISYSSIVEPIKQDVIGYAPADKKSTCFFDDESRQKLASKLENASIKYELRDKRDGIKCIYWAPEDDEKVIKIQPRILEMRQLEAERIANQK